MTKTMIWGQVIVFTLTLVPFNTEAKTNKTLGRSVAGSIQEPLSLAEIQRDIRLSHARELLGKYYKRSVVKTGEDVKKINTKIYAWTKERLPAKYKAQYKKVAQTIIDESVKRQFDPVFLLSVIQNESSFDPKMKGALDEIGLMQLRPATAKWMAEKFSIKYKNSKSLYDPCTNIKIGAAYLDYLRDELPHAQLYISAYNMGKRNVENLLEEDTWPKIYANHVMKFYVEFYQDIREAKLAHKRKTT